MTGGDAPSGALRLRVGVVMWALSWVPYGLLLGLSGMWLSLSWALEVLPGVVGIALAGSVFATAVNAHGWRGAPAVAWNAFLHGTDDHCDLVSDVVKERGLRSP